MRRYALQDDQWDRIEALLPAKAGDRGRTALDNRLFVEAVLYRYRAMDLSRNCAAPLIAYYAQKENDYGNETHRRI